MNKAIAFNELSIYFQSEVDEFERTCSDDNTEEVDEHYARVTDELDRYRHIIGDDDYFAISAILDNTDDPWTVALKNASDYCAELV